MAPCAAGTAGRTVGTRTHLARLLAGWQEGSTWLCLLLVLAPLQRGITGAAQTPSGVECIIFNKEHMTCMWNSQGRPEVNNSLFYWYSDNEASIVECQRYLQEGGINTGCWFGAAELRYFRGFNIRVNGSHGREEVVIPTTEMRLQNLVKLGPPVNLTIENVTNNQLLLRWSSSYHKKCVEFKVKYRSNKETEYTELEVSNQFEYTYPSVDPEKFYTFYVSAKVYWLCASTNLWSDWSVPIHWGKKPTEGDEDLTAEDHTNDQQSLSPPPAHGLSDQDSLDSLDDELEAGPSGVPQTQRSRAPIHPTTTSAATTPQQTPAVTAPASAAATTATATTTSNTSSTLPVPGDDQPTPTTVEDRESVCGPTVARQQVRGSRAGGRARVTTRPREEWTPSLDHFTRVVDAYREVQGQSGRSDELLQELILLMRSIDNRLGQMVDLMGQQVALQRDRPVAQTTPPSPPVVPQAHCAPSSPASTERGESSAATGHSAGPPPSKRSRGRPKKSQ